MQSQSPAGQHILRAPIARRVMLGAVLIGAIADPLLRNGPWGFGLLLWMIAFAITVVALAASAARSLSRESRTWLAIAVMFAAGLSWRDSDLLLFFDIVAMLTALTLLAMSMNGIPVASLAAARVRDLIRAAFGTALDVAFGVVPLVVSDAGFDAGARPAGTGNASRIVKAVVITVPMLLVFTLLLMRADPVFGSFLTLPEINFGELVSHVVVAGFFAWIAAGWLRRSLLPSARAADDETMSFPLTLGATDIAVAFGALNTLFAAFVIVQIGWLYGGEALVVRTTGLTYAEYARRGFFELMGVAALLLPVLLAAHALIPATDSRTHRLFRRLALPLVALLGAVMASAGARMNLYIRFYGISTDRLYATAIMVWLAIVFAWFALTLLRSRPRAFAAGLVMSAYGVLAALNIINPDALVAAANIARGGPGSGMVTGSDPRYVASLGGDAVPALVAALTAVNIASDSAGTRDRCDAARILLSKWTGPRRMQMSRNWFQWNFARMQAARDVRDHEAQLRQLACPATPGHS